MRSWVPLALSLIVPGIPAIAAAQAAPSPRAAPLADAQACYAGRLERCATAGDAYHEGAGVPVSFPLAAALYRYGCERGEPASCRALGWVSQEGHGVAQSLGAARRWFGVACDAGLGLACYDLGTLHWIGRGVAPSWEQGRALYERSCELGHAEGCREVAYVHGRGMGVPPDAARMGELLGRACELGSATACDEARDPGGAIARAERERDEDGDGDEGEDEDDRVEGEQRARGDRVREPDGASAEPALHHDPGISDAQFATLLGRFQRETRASERRTLAHRLAAGGVRLTCAQIAALMRTVALDSERIALAVALWPSAIDPGSFGALESALQHAGSRTLLRDQTRP